MAVYRHLQKADQEADLGPVADGTVAAPRE